jgi:hypothetical protein
MSGKREQNFNKSEYYVHTMLTQDDDVLMIN